MIGVTSSSFIGGRWGDVFLALALSRLASGEVLDGLEGRRARGDGGVADRLDPAGLLGLLRVSGDGGVAERRGEAGLPGRCSRELRRNSPTLERAKRQSAEGMCERGLSHMICQRSLGCLLFCTSYCFHFIIVNVLNRKICNNYHILGIGVRGRLCF